MRLRRCLAFAGLSVLLCGSSLWAQGPPMSDGFVLSEKEAIWLAPPSLAAGPAVEQAVWSPDGQYLLVKQIRMRLSPSQWRGVLRSVTREAKLPAGDVVVGLWRRDAGRFSEVLQLPLDSAGVEELCWMPGSPTALARVFRFVAGSSAEEPPVRSIQLYRIDAAAARADAVTDPVAAADMATFSVSPSSPLAVFLPSREFGVLIGSRGRPARIAVPEGVAVSEVGWTSGGAVPYLICPGPAPSWYAVAPSGALSRLDRQPEQVPAIPRKPPAFKLAAGMPMKENGLPLATRPVWLAPAAGGDSGKALVSADAEDEMLSPDGDAVYYVTSGAAFVRQVIRMPVDEFQAVELARRAAVRAQLASRAKQIGLAMLMFSADHDDALPAGKGSLMTDLRPYFGPKADTAETMLDEFVLTFDGGLLSKADRPAETELGHIAGPGGRVVLFIDGHVEWRDDR